MLQATKQQPPSNKVTPILCIHKKTNVSFNSKHQTNPKFIKLRPKSQTNISNSFCFNIPHKNRQKALDQFLNQNSFQHQSLFLINDSNSWQKQTRRTSLEKSFKEDYQSRKIDILLDTPSLSITLRPVLTLEQNVSQKKSIVIKLKRAQKQYSPINKLLELQNSRKSKISLLSKQLYNKMK